MRQGIGMFVVLILVLGMSGVAYAHWSETLYISGTVDTGELDLEFSSAVCNEHPEAEGKDVGHCEVVLIDTDGDGDHDTVQLTITNGYPCYACDVVLDIHNNGTVPANLVEYDFDVTGDLAPWVEVSFSGTWDGFPQIDPCQTVTGVISIHIAQEDSGGNVCLEDSSATITGHAEFRNWNESNPPVPPPSPLPLYLYPKDPSTWEIIDNGTWAMMVYNEQGPTFEYMLDGHGLKPNIDYSLIYYADPWPGNHPGALIDSGTTDDSGELHLAGSVELNMDLPHPDDANYPHGAKIWLVPSSDYDPLQTKMVAWNPTEYLFEGHLITYDDTQV